MTRFETAEAGWQGGIRRSSSSSSRDSSSGGGGSSSSNRIMIILGQVIVRGWKEMFKHV